MTAKTLPDHLFVGTEGQLFDTRVDQWHRKPALRDNYRRVARFIRTTADLKATLRCGGYAWPGGYPMFLMTQGGDCVSFEGAIENLETELQNIKHGTSDAITYCDINWEDDTMYCSVTNERIESAYGENEDE